MPVTNKQHPLPTRKVALRDLPNENIVVNTQGTPPAKRKRPLSEAVNVSGAKRHYPDRPPSPRQQSTSDAVLTGGLATASPHGKLKEMRSPEMTVLSSPVLERPAEDGEQSYLQQPRISLFPDSSPIPENSPAFSLGSPIFSPSSKIYWKDRFLMLQKFLNQCDQSDQEDYIQMLRSTSAAVRSKHAIELEKRAIHLLLEEGKELRRMKHLNVLGKPSPE